MSEGLQEYLPHFEEAAALAEYAQLAKELSKSPEGLPFPGVTGENYNQLKAATEAHPDYSTPVDDLLERFRQHGMKIIVAEGNNLLILPGDSENLDDSITPLLLDIADGMDPRLKRLIAAYKGMVNRA